MIEELVEIIYYEGLIDNKNETMIDEILVFTDESLSEVEQWRQGLKRSRLDISPVIAPQNIRIYPFSGEIPKLKSTIIAALGSYLEEISWREVGKGDSRHQWLVAIATTSLDIEVVSSIQYLLTTLSIFTGDNTGLLNFPQCVIITTISPPALGQYSYASSLPSECFNSQDYEHFLQYLSPSLPTKVVYLPSHCIDIFHPVSSSTSSLLSCLECKILLNQALRLVAPINLHHLEANHPSSISSTASDKDCHSVLEITDMSDLPAEMKQVLNSFSYEIAGSLVFDLQVDVESSIFTLGKTSSLLGKVLKDILPAIKNLYESQNLPKGSTSNPYSLKQASFILIDRTEDMYTPTSYCGVETQSLAHRVYNALKFRAASLNEEDQYHGDQLHKSSSKIIDISLEPLFMTSLREALNDGRVEDAYEQYFYPMSALSGLSFQAKPSICIHSDKGDGQDEEIDQLRKLFFAHGEEEFRTAIVRKLRKVIQLERGSLPVAKKRGLGAEILAYVQAIMDSPGLEFGDSKESVIYRHINLLSLCLSVIETMQRSSGKQFYSICDWKCAVDVRCARDSELRMSMKSIVVDSGVNTNSPHHEDFDAIVTKAMKPLLCSTSLSQKYSSSSLNYSQTSAVSSPRKSVDKSPSGTKPAKSSKEDDNNYGPVDAIHIILQIIGLLSLYRYQTISVEFVKNLASHLSDYLLDQRRENEELLYMHRIGILSTPVLASIQEYRSMMEADTENSSRYSCREALQKLLNSDSLKALSEFCSSSLMRNRQLMENNMFDLVISSPYNLLDYGLMKSSDSQDIKFMNQGLFASIIEDCIIFDDENPKYDQRLLPGILEHVGGSLLNNVAKAGLDILSKSMERFGFSFVHGSSRDSREHPANQEIVVLAIIGGVSWKEVAQIQSIIADYPSCNKKIVVLSNSIINAEDMLRMMFRR